MEEEARSEAQREIDSILLRGIIFSLVWLAGIGSAIAIYSGLKAKKLITRLGPEAKGMGRAWWCIIAGGLGLSFWGFVMLMGLINNLAGR
jgi:membrane protein YqaA with SNARE-associated domain